MEHLADYKGGKLFYTVKGAGETVVLVHGYLESTEVWGGFADELAHKFRVISIDLPGNGRSSLYKEEHTMCFLADAVLAVLDREKAARVTAVGHSLGGYVTLSIVERFPERLKGYVLFHSHPFADSDEARKNRIREIGIVESGKKEVIYPVNIPKMFADSNLEIFSSEVEESKRIASEHEAEGIISVLYGMMNRKARDNIMAASDVPVLVILGTMDNYIDYNSIINRLILPPAGKIVTLERSGHMGFIEERDRSVEIVAGFVNSVKGR